MRSIDLRGNKIGKGAIRVLAEALERAERVRHVYVHAGGKIEALGAGKWAEKNKLSNKGPENDEAVDPKMMVTVETVCVVDVRENDPESIQAPYELQEFSGAEAHQSNGQQFAPTQLLEPTHQAGGTKRSMTPKGKSRGNKQETKPLSASMENSVTVKEPRAMSAKDIEKAKKKQKEKVRLSLSLPVNTLYLYIINKYLTITFHSLIITTILLLIIIADGRARTDG